MAALGKWEWSSLLFSWGHKARLPYIILFSSMCDLKLLNFKKLKTNNLQKIK